MENNNFSLINFGNSNQKNILIINANIDTSIKRIEKDFFDGNFKQAVEDLDSLIQENIDNIKIKFQLLLVKISFLFSFRNIEDAKEYIELLETNYSDFINNIKFKELKLSLLAFLKDQSFFDLSKSIRLENKNTLPQGHFDIVFYLNTGNLDKAKEIFEKEIQNDEYRDKLLLVGGHIYSNSYKYISDDKTTYNLANKYYQEALEKDNLTFLDKMQIQSFYAVYYMNNQILQKKEEANLIEYIKEYKYSLENIIENRQYFSNRYIENLIDNYIHCLLSLKLTDEYCKFFEDNKDTLQVRHFISYSEIKQIDINHNSLQKKIINSFTEEDFLIYISLVYEDDNSKRILSFLNENKTLIFYNSFSIYCYVKATILENKNLTSKVLNNIKKHKSNNLEYLLALLKYKSYLNKNISKEEINNLINLSKEWQGVSARIIDTIKLLKKLEYRKEYLDLALYYQNKFLYIISDTLFICKDDENLLFDDFNEFIESIEDKSKLNYKIGQIYYKYDNLEKAFNYYYEEYNLENFCDIALALLEISMIYFNRYNQKIDNKKQREVFNYLISKLDILQINQVSFLVAYSFSVQEDTKATVPFINQYLLKSNIEKISESEKINISSSFFPTFGNQKNALLDFKENKCLEKDDITYILDEYYVSEENTNNFNLHAITENEYILKQQDESYNETSLFHRIVGIFAFKCKHPSIVSFTLNEEEDILEQFSKILGDPAKPFERYIEGKEIGFYSLSNHDYEKYFSLVPYLLENKNIPFISNYCNLVPNNTNKILTLSSIIFLNHINKLDKILLRDDIFIQRTLINWLLSYVKKLNDCNEIYTLSKNINYNFNSLKDIKEIEKYKKEILDLAHKLSKSKIIDDHKEVFPIRGADTKLTPYFGRQEYQAFAYSIKHNFQIISEDRMFQILFDVTKSNNRMISNSISLLENQDDISIEELINLKISLDSKQYKYVFNESVYYRIISYMGTLDLSIIKEKKALKIIEIINNYKWFDDDIKNYHKKFEAVNVKNTPPNKTLFDKNIEFILKKNLYRR